MKRTQTIESINANKYIDDLQNFFFFGHVREKCALSSPHIMTR